MALQKELAEDLVEGLYHRQFEKSTLMQNASALYHSDQVHRKEPTCNSKLKAVVTEPREGALPGERSRLGTTLWPNALHQQCLALSWRLCSNLLTVGWLRRDTTDGISLQ